MIYIYTYITTTVYCLLYRVLLLHSENCEKQNRETICLWHVIIKPDIGFRGLLVKKLNSDADLATYIEKHSFIDLILQEYIDLPNECGIFYTRLPNAEKGKISSITLKKFLAVEGDGSSTILELIRKDKRAVRYEHLIKEFIANHIFFL